MGRWTHRLTERNGNERDREREKGKDAGERYPNKEAEREKKAYRD